MTRLDQSKNNGKILVRILPGVLVLPVARVKIRVQHICGRIVAEGYSKIKDYPVLRLLTPRHSSPLLNEKCLISDNSIN